MKERALSCTIWCAEDYDSKAARRVSSAPRPPSIGAGVRAAAAIAECDSEAGGDEGVVLHRAAAGWNVQVAIGHRRVPLQPPVQLRPQRDVEGHAVIAELADGGKHRQRF